MKLNNIRDNAGAHKKKMCVGRGIGCGKGKTCGRGVKGQKARTGVALGGFIGGQMPLQRRMPKRGFKSLFGTDYAELTLSRLQSAIDSKRVDAKKAITEEALLKAGIVRRSHDGVRLLGSGEIKVKVELVIASATAGAIAAVEKAGGKVTLPAKEAEAA